MVKLFGHGSAFSGLFGITKNNTITKCLFEELSSLEFAQMWIDLTYSYSSIFATTLKDIIGMQNYAGKQSNLSIVNKPIFVSSATSKKICAEYYVKGSSSTCPPSHFSLYVGAGLVALPTSPSFRDYFHTISQHVAVETGNHVFTGNHPEFGLRCHPAPPPCSPMEFMGFNKASVDQWLDKYFYQNYVAIDKSIKALSELKPGNLRDGVGEDCLDFHSVYKYLESRRNWSESVEEYYFWESQINVTRAEYTWIQDWVIPEIEYRLATSTSTFTSSTSTASEQEICAIAAKVLIRYSTIKSWIYSFEEKLNHLCQTGLNKALLESVMLSFTKQVGMAQQWLCTRPNLQGEAKIEDILEGMATVAQMSCERDLLRAAIYTIKAGQTYYLSVFRSVALSLGVQIRDPLVRGENEELDSEVVENFFPFLHKFTKAFPILSAVSFLGPLEAVLSDIHLFSLSLSFYYLSNHLT